MCCIQRTAPKPVMVATCAGVSSSGRVLSAAASFSVFAAFSCHWQLDQLSPDRQSRIVSSGNSTIIRLSQNQQASDAAPNRQCVEPSLASSPRHSPQRFHRFDGPGKFLQAQPTQRGRVLKILDIRSPSGRAFPQQRLELFVLASRKRLIELPHRQCANSLKRVVVGSLHGLCL